ncbi:MAG: hypothetical protein ABJN69_01940 [Hellea sp.]
MRVFTKRNAKRVFLSWLLLNLILLIIYWPLVKQLARFSPIILPVSYSAPVDLVESQTQDIQHLKRILKYDRSFSDEERLLFIDHLEHMSQAAGRMSEAEFFLGVSKAMAIAENGHSNVSKGPAYRSFNRSGIDVYWFSDGLFIVRAHQSAGDLVGARIIEIEGRTPEDVSEGLGAYIGGAESWKRLYSLYFLRSPDLMHAAGLAASPDSLHIKIVNQIGQEQAVLLTALPAAKEKASYARSALIGLSGKSLPDEEERWRRTLTAKPEALPLYLRSFDENFLKEPIGNGVYVRAAVLFNRDGMSIKERLAELVTNAPHGGFDFIAFDLRFSPGGDFGNVSEFAKTVETALSEDGKLYVLTGPQTFSAAIVSTALFKRYVPEKTLLIGQPMGDYGQFWAERGMSFKLPNTGYNINYATGYHDWEKGCTATHKYCFPRNARHDGIEVSLKPDALITPSYQDYASGRDIVMEWVLADANAD